MDNALIKSLIAALEASTLSELEYSRDGTTIRLVKGDGSAPRAASAGAFATPAPPNNNPPAAATPASDLIAAPLFGVVHLQRSPGTPPLVTAGQAVSAGQVLCLIEAMKVFTELRAELDGTIAEILIETGQEVEAGQPLFRWE